MASSAVPAAPYLVGKVPAVLRPYVRSVSAYDMTLPKPGEHVGAPSTDLTFVVPLDDPLDVSWRRQSGSRRRLLSCVSGLHTRPAVIHHPGRQRGVHLALTVSGARALLGRPAADLSGHLVQLEDVSPHLADLPERFHDLTGWAERVEVLVDHLLRATRQEPAAARPEVGEALRRLAAGVPVAAVAREVGYSRRHLTALVRAECGVGPKEFARIARFQRCRAALVADARAGRADLAALAATYRYADQSHLSREWVAMTGLSPRAWLKAEFPFLQDHAELGVAHSGEEREETP